jgi:hypothetical protein
LKATRAEWAQFWALLQRSKSRTIYNLLCGDWLAALDDFRNWLVREAARA